jgi:hypothetical protein
VVEGTKTMGHAMQNAGYVLLLLLLNLAEQAPSHKFV